MSREEVITTRSANDISLNFSKLIIYAVFGLINLKALEIGSAVALAAVMAAFTTRSALRFLGENVFRKIGYLSMALSGILLLTQSIFHIAIDVKSYLSLKPGKLAKRES